MNCRTHEHRHFERILRTVARHCPCLAQGRLNIHRDSFSRIGLSPSDRRGFKVRALVRRFASAANSRERSWVGCAALSPSRGSKIYFFCPGSLHFFRPESRQDYPPNLSILISGGKENNCDAPSNGERNGQSPAPNRRPSRSRGMWCLGESPRSATSSPSPP